MSSPGPSRKKKMRSARKASRLKRIRKIGQPPGTLVYIGEVKTEHPFVTVCDYTTDHINEQSLTANAALTLTPPDTGIRWVNVYGLHDAALIARLGINFGLHPLTLEDILNTEQRPKVDSFENNLFIVTRVFEYNPIDLDISSEQISFVLGRNFVLTFQERKTDAFNPVIERLRSKPSHLRQWGADYLIYTLLDMVVDRYFIVLEQLSDACEALEDDLLNSPTSVTLSGIHRLKRECMELRRSVWPLREVINHLIRNEQGMFTSNTILYLRDVYDHIVHFIESVEAIRDMLAGMMDIYLSSVSNRVNMELRALTVVAMLFMPATLIAGIFGMNFEIIPWTRDAHGFWYALGVMAAIALIMGMIFWRRQWLARSDLS